MEQFAMNIHEYQAKQLLKSYGCPVSEGRPVYNALEARSADTGHPYDFNNCLA